jgi:hypothetical protein
VVAASTLVLFRQIAPMATAQMLMSFPIFLQELVLGVWLIVKGFNPSATASPRPDGSAVPQRRAS